ncbi:tetratricopeptide repeat protein [Rickettsia endosymbiont of Halotydeus destructor]|uniref:tetratricopeptide repeat protein n=1 Tax=Rickettsia endosymbiont of Halotydeus destructor TaxID=2996754 RepID=UPI003BB0400D
MKKETFSSDSFSNNYEEAIELFNEQQNEEALVLFKKSITQSPNNPKQLAEIYFYMGRAFLRIKNNDEALIHFKKSIQEQPDDIRIINKLGETCFKLGQYEKAANYCDQLIALNYSLLKSYYNKGNILLNLAIDNNLKDQEIGKQAIECYKKVLEIEGSNYKKDAEQIYTNKGNEIPALNQKKIKELDKEIAEIIAWKGGVALVQFNDIEKALADYDKALEIDINCLGALENKAKILVDFEQFDEALEIYESIIKLVPSTEVLINKIIILIEASSAGEGEKSEEYFNQAIITFNTIPNEKNMTFEQFYQNVLVEDEYKEGKISEVNMKIANKKLRDSNFEPKCFELYNYNDQDEGYASDELPVVGSSKNNSDSE